MYCQRKIINSYQHVLKRFTFLHLPNTRYYQPLKVRTNLISKKGLSFYLFIYFFLKHLLFTPPKNRPMVAHDHTHRVMVLLAPMIFHTQVFKITQTHLHRPWCTQPLSNPSHTTTQTLVPSHTYCRSHSPAQPRSPAQPVTSLLAVTNRTPWLLSVASLQSAAAVSQRLTPKELHSRRKTLHPQPERRSWSHNPHSDTHARSQGQVSRATHLFFEMHK